MSTERVVKELFESIEAFKNLGWVQKESLANLVTQRLWLIQQKLSTSNYSPLKNSRDPLGVNSNFASALSGWIEQFPEPCRPGALALGISISYFTDAELKSHLEFCCAQFRSEQSDRVARGGSGREVVPYALTDRTDIYAEFLHQMGLSGTSNRDFKTAGPVESHLMRAAQAVNSEAIGAALPGSGYYDLGILIDSLLDKHYAIIEDWALSGKTMAEELNQFLFLLNVLFGKTEVRKSLDASGRRLPRVTIVLPVATEVALKAIEEVFAYTSVDIGVDHRVISGLIFEDKNRLGEGCTLAWLKEFRQCAPGIKWRSLAVQVCEAYAAGAERFPDKNVLPAEQLGKETLKYGYGRGGWAIVGFSNCPDNSLPLYWRPYKISEETQYIPLFPRVAASVKPEGTGDQIREWLRVAAQDRQGKLLRAVLGHLAT